MICPFRGKRHRWIKRGQLAVINVHGRAIVVCWTCEQPDVESGAWWRWMKRTDRVVAADLGLVRR